MRAWAASLLTVVVLTAMACGTPAPPGSPELPGAPGLPGWARPDVRKLDAGAVRMGDVIAYRTLTRADFLGTQPPGRMAGHHEKLGATTCAYVKPAGPARIETRGPLPGAAEHARYEAVLRGVRFEAVMDRSCSWWNERSGIDESFVLQHEQIHFALVELAARRLDAQAAGLVGEPASADSPEAAAQVIRERIDASIARTVEELLEESSRFDEETSARRDRDGQQRWWDRVSRELEVPTDR